MAPLPMPERADAADASRLVELSVRRGWPLASLRKAPFEDRHAVLAGFALYAEAGKGDAADAAKKFLAGAGSFLSGTPEELMISLWNTDGSRRMAPRTLRWDQERRSGGSKLKLNLRRRFVRNAGKRSGGSFRRRTVK